MRMQRLATLAFLAIATTANAFAKPPVQVLGSRAIETQGCPAGSYSIVTSPDGGALSVLFDNFVVNGTEANGGFARMTCAIEIPLRLPEGYSLGVYNVDYRGFAALEEKQRGALQVDYGVGRGNRERRFRRQMKGVYQGDFTFSESLRGAVLRRAGCGETAMLNFAATLTIESKRGARQGTMALDSVDGTNAPGLVFGLDLKKCRT